ncbi:sugar ABC transporter ATP-binding protein [Phytoactinopolyspora halotolerans]|uniref:Sugar ABC transporter ATP-binding protein n=1 Tax=Phytoactinopolyspora halotolerans TaxID=1981512 RepID=A0A6L9SH12_9ACTN|nr:sugar ABC transporter ATP-binding protein [Phytoactinopolyspora halotolerans]NEE03702.1 sugar ABC transporter ATP-binding protein [Phytoactinopolyspora halotolerans]
MNRGVRTVAPRRGLAAMNGGAPAIEVRQLSKSYPGVRALHAVSLSLAHGEVRALMGKNGAGKSTLVEILSGSVQPDSGQVLVGGEAVRMATPADARRHGIATVHQELSLVPGLTVAENIMLGRWRDAPRRAGLISPAGVAAYARAYLDELELEIDPHVPVAHLSIAAQQTVEVARALSYRPDVLILDEPTSSLPADDVELLLALVRRLAASGVAVIYVSHRMDEIHKVADSVTVLRDGEHVDSQPIEHVSTQDIVVKMTGGAIHNHRPESSSARDPVVLSVRGLAHGTRLQDISFELRAGEVLGLAGLLGAGRTELLRCLYGLDRPERGTVELDGRSYAPRSPRAAIRAGIGFAPEERKHAGLALGMSVSSNLVLACMNRVRRAGMLSRRRERAVAEATRDRLAIKTPELSTAVGILSGGNQQKVVLGKCLNARARILLLDEPTRGVDVEAKDQIYQLIRDTAAAGASVIVASSEFEELGLVCDRVLILRNGTVAADRPMSELSVSEVMALAMGGANS